jgi:hypothetical protein
MIHLVHHKSRKMQYRDNAATNYWNMKIINLRWMLVCTKTKTYYFHTSHYSSNRKSMYVSALNIINNFHH